MKKNDKKTIINKKILESKKIIKEEKEKIKIEKRNIRRKKYEKFKESKFGSFMDHVISFFKIDKDNYSFSEVFVITLVSLVIGAFACFSVFTIFSGGRNYFKVANDLDKFLDVYETLVENYNDGVDKDELINNAINGMVSGFGDIYTSYVDTENTKEFDELVNGVYEGIGCTIQLQEDGIKVIKVFENGPADKAGLLVGDIILEVDDINARLDKINIKEFNVNTIANYIMKESSGRIKMIVLRDDQEKTLELKRDKVEMPVVSGEVYEKNGKKIGYLSISIFSSVAAKQFKNELQKLEDKGIDGLVIDVRNNNGGYLTTVTDILSYLLPRGKVLYQVEKNNNRESTKDKTFKSCDYPIAVLVNGNSASASEILAAAIKESYNGYVVGTKTFGKGTVQQIKKLSDGSMIKYTVENWLTPDGNWIDGNGIEPTDIVEFDTVYYENPSFDNDNQLQKALDLVSK